MSKIGNCKCPLCNQAFIPDDGLAAADYLAHGIILAFAEIQKKADSEDSAANKLPCPRCGSNNMLTGASRNALCRHFDVYICPNCGNDEAIRIFKNMVLPAASWWVVSKIFI
jgi:predicted RNA-binding Zn-ribbon protein involved in translation (DUF1610 family)